VRIRSLKHVVIGLAVLLTVALAATVASAANVHFKKPALQFVDQNVVLMSRRPNRSWEQERAHDGDGYGRPETTCTNQGGNQAPGQNPAEVTVPGASRFRPARSRIGT